MFLASQLKPSTLTNGDNMTFVARNLGWLADNVFGMDRPQVPQPTAPNNSSIDFNQPRQRSQNIAAPKTERSRSDSLGAYGSGQSGLALDPLGRRGGGFIGGGKSLLGR